MNVRIVLDLEADDIADPRDIAEAVQSLIEDNIGFLTDGLVTSSSIHNHETV